MDLVSLSLVDGPALSGQVSDHGSATCHPGPSGCIAIYPRCVRNDIDDVPRAYPGLNRSDFRSR